MMQSETKETEVQKKYIYLSSHLHHLLKKKIKQKMKQFNLRTKACCSDFEV